MKDLAPRALRAYSPYSYTTGNAAIWIIELIQANCASTIVTTVIPPIQKFNNNVTFERPLQAIVIISSH